MSDPASQSNFLDITTEHAFFDWTLDFEGKVIKGFVVHDLRIKTDSVSEVIFDTADLVIESAEVADVAVSFEIKARHKVLGSALHVPLPAGLKSGDSVSVKVVYQTTIASTALQWLDKEATQGKTFPFLFSQCQPIHARTLGPVQDTPSVKMTYGASVKSKLPALLSAIRVSPPSEGPAHDGKVIGTDVVEYVYNQPVPIPSYLMAIAAGNVIYRAFPKPDNVQWKTGIWAEPELIEAAYWEFSDDTARFLAAEEKIVTPYRFGVFDLLMLPPSFPYGGMENSCLTFLTPTLLAGDRSLVDVVVHELTHSWFGNGVRNANTSHFWLNEGWTTYIERVLQEFLHSPAARGFSFVIGSKALFDALKQYESNPRYQRLVIDFKFGEDPDDAYSSIPYEKGSNLLLHLERSLGGLEKFLPYVRDYVTTFSGQSITTSQWKSHLYAFWEKHGGPEKVKILDSVDWDAWFFGEGIELPVKMEYDISLAQEAYNLASRWDASRSLDHAALDFKKTDLEKFDTNQIIVFLERLQSYKALPSVLVTHLGTLYGLSSTSNAEVRFRFYQVALLDPTSSAAALFAQEGLKWVVGNEGPNDVVKGRMKFCRPVFRAIARVNKADAVEVFQKNRLAFHPIAIRLIAKDLGLI